MCVWDIDGGAPGNLGLQFKWERDMSGDIMCMLGTVYDAGNRDTRTAGDEQIPGVPILRPPVSRLSTSIVSRSRR